jgi:hypothetical protein
MRDLKKYGLGLCMLLSFAWVGCETEGPDNYKNHFIKYYGGDGNQEAKDLIINPDGSVVMVGTSTIANSKKVYVVRANEQGKQLWSLEFGGDTNETGQDIEQIISGPDAGNYLVVSNVAKSVEDSLAIRLTVVSEMGDSLKSFLIDRYESQEARSLTVLASGEYYITGKVKNSDTLNVEFPGFDLEDSFDMVIGNNYTLVSSERTGGSTIASGIKIIEKPNTINYALYTDEKKIEKDHPDDDPDGLHEVNFVFRRFDKIASSERTFYAGETRVHEYLADIDQAFSGVFMAVGTQIDPSDISVSSLYACVINSSYFKPLLIQGNIEGSPTRAEGVSVVHALEANFFWVLGNEIRAGGEGRNIWVGKVDASNLNTVFSRKFGGSSNDDTGSKILQLDNGDVLILGTMELVNQKKMALIKINESGSF